MILINVIILSNYMIGEVYCENWFHPENIIFIRRISARNPPSGWHNPGPVFVVTCEWRRYPVQCTYIQGLPQKTIGCREVKSRYSLSCLSSLVFFFKRDPVAPNWPPTWRRNTWHLETLSPWTARTSTLKRSPCFSRSILTRVLNSPLARSMLGRNKCREISSVWYDQSENMRPYLYEIIVK